MSRRRIRVRTDDGVEAQCRELAAIWRVLPDGLDIDGGQSEVKLASTKAAHSRPPVHEPTEHALLTVMTGVEVITVAVNRALETAYSTLDVPGALALLPAWHARAEPELAGRIEADLTRWLHLARRALGLTRPPKAFGYECPDHRSEDPQPLVILGATARLPATLLDGPPVELLPDGRVVVRGEATPWLIPRGDRIVWAGETTAFQWDGGGGIQCPACERCWTTAQEKRLLALELRALGEKINDEFLREAS